MDKKNQVRERLVALTGLRGLRIYPSIVHLIGG